jgi:dTDP-4-amino-4,6-dideoxygalactose transaminase
MKTYLTARTKRKGLRRTAAATPVPAMCPRLPAADRVLPYLRKIDALRQYSNWGPLACDFEHRLSEHFSLPAGSVVVASSGTAALIGAILATAGRANAQRPLAIIPAFTFVATAVAAEQCGYRPYLVDVSADTWLLNAGELTGHSLLGDVGLVVPVATFGRPVPQDEWRDFRRQTGIPVVIDGAASFETVSAVPGRFAGEIPTVISFHATKSFGTGEGGCVLTADAALAVRVTQALNFGFYASRSSRAASTNGKMSEYHAAVGLAELDGWPQKSAALLDVSRRYRRRLARAGLAARFVSAPAIAACYALLRCVDVAESIRVQKSLTDANIEFRLWYGRGIHTEPYFSDVRHGEIPVTDAVAPCTVGLPVAPDLTDSVISRIVSAARRGIARS